MSQSRLSIRHSSNSIMLQQAYILVILCVALKRRQRFFSIWEWYLNGARQLRRSVVREQEQQQQFLIHCKKDLKRQAHTLSGDAGRKGPIENGAASHRGGGGGESDRGVTERGSESES